MLTEHENTATIEFTESELKLLFDLVQYANFIVEQEEHAHMAQFYGVKATFNVYEKITNAMVESHHGWDAPPVIISKKG